MGTLFTCQLLKEGNPLHVWAGLLCLSDYTNDQNDDDDKYDDPRGDEKHEYAGRESLSPRVRHVRHRVTRVVVAVRGRPKVVQHLKVTPRKKLGYSICVFLADYRKRIIKYYLKKSLEIISSNLKKSQETTVLLPWK